MKHLISLLALTAALIIPSAAKPETIKTIAIGAVAPNFSLPGVDGKNHTLNDFATSKVLVIIFTCNHCPDARAARGKVIALHKDYKDKGVAVIAISGNDDKALRLDEIGYSVYGDSLEDMKCVAKEEKYTSPYLYDGSTQKTTKAYGAVSTPHVFVFNADRKLCYTGRIDDARRSPKDIGEPLTCVKRSILYSQEKTSPPPPPAPSAVPPSGHGNEVAWLQITPSGKPCL